MGLMGLTPVQGAGKSQAITATSTAAVALPTQASGVEAPTSGGTGTFPSRYVSLLMITALSANGWIRFGSSAVGTATATTGGYDLLLPTGIPILYRRPIATTHYRVIGDGTGALHMSPLEFYTDEVN